MVTVEQQLKDATLNVIAAHGLKGATTRRIAETAGVAELTLFRHFGSKASLIEAALLDLTSAFDEHIHPGDDVATDLTAFVSVYTKALRTQHRLLVVAFAEAQRHAEFSVLLRAQTARLQKLADLIEHHQQARQLRPEPPREAALALIGPLVMTALVLNAQPGFVTLPAPHDHVRAFLAGRQLRPDNQQELS
ncbi:TetR/AcrR family transcriptional regulator [Deinococcus oregonensis]|uniref:TetR/AcrR family transcriptional regulator n=1 Tax=Deinococcus oregonensis TaxID=1805970 RepID=A0ABV6B179_9DEIO